MHLFLSRSLIAPTTRPSVFHKHIQQKATPLFCQTFATRTTNSTTTTDEHNHTRQKSLRLYRILLRQCHRLFPTSEHHEWLLQPKLHPQDYGQAQTFSLDTKEQDHDDDDKIIFDVLNLFCKWSSLGDEEKAGHFDASWSWFLSVVQSTNYYKQQMQNNKTKIMDWETDLLNSIDETSNKDSQWVSRHDLTSAIRHAFQTKNSNNSNNNTCTIDSMTPIHGLAIQAVRLLNEQESMMERTSVSVQHGLRVVATSRCIGTASSGGNNNNNPLESSTLDDNTMKHRFAYRIRVENLSTNQDTVQLLGRKWCIQETNDKMEHIGNPVSVVALTTGAVGHLPVLKPGQVFAYMSGCELSTRTGTMKGSFQMAVVPHDTESAIVGDAVDALSSKTKFEMPVEPFLLLAK